jgi:hypothetical protein
MVMKMSAKLGSKRSICWWRQISNVAYPLKSMNSVASVIEICWVYAVAESEIFSIRVTNFFKIKISCQLPSWLLSSNKLISQVWYSTQLLIKIDNCNHAVPIEILASNWILSKENTQKFWEEDITSMTLCLLIDQYIVFELNRSGT